MYLHRPQPSWLERLLSSARTLAAIVLTAVLASALTVHWSDATATAVTATGATASISAIPVTVEGTVVGVGDGQLAVIEHGSASAVAFTVGEDADLVRGGEIVSLDALRGGDTVRLTIDGLSGSVLRLHADPAAVSGFHVPGAVALLAAVGFIGGAAALAVRNPDRLPRLPSRLMATRLVPAGVAR
jgi:hypothetical protein